MRNKKWLILVVALLIIGVLSMTLVACKPPKVDPVDKEMTTEEIIEKVIGNISDTYLIDDARMFGIDVLADAELANASDNSRIWKYEFLAKADIDLYSERTSMRVELNSYAKDAEGKDVKTTLFGLFYESEFDVDGNYNGSYFYVVIGGSDPIKTEAYSMLKLVNAIAGDPNETVAELDITETIVSVIAMFATDAKVDGETYTLVFDLQKVWENLSPLLAGFISDPSSLGSLLGDPALADTITGIIGAADGMIGEIFGDLTYNVTVEDDPATEGNEAGVKEEKVDSLIDLIYYLDQNMPYVMINAAFKFESDEFKSVNITADYQARTADGVYNAITHKFTANIHKAFVGDDTVDVDEGYVLKPEERAKMKASINLVNFSINGTIDCIRGSKKYETLTWSLNVDINPFVLAEGITADTFKKLGYLNLTINKPNGSNLLTLHTNTKDGYMVVSFLGYSDNMYLKNLGIGGVYEFGALMDIITIMGGGKVDVNNVADEEDMTSGIISAIIGGLDFSNLQENGLVIDTTKSGILKIFDYIKTGDALADSFLSSIVKEVIFNSADSIHFKVNENGVQYGKAVKVANSDLAPTILRDGDIMGVTGAKLNSESDIRTNYEFGERDLDINFQNKDGNNAKTFLVKGKDVLSGKNVTMNAVYMGSTLDSSIVGKQKVRVYYGTNTVYNNLAGLGAGAVKNLLAGNAMLPLFGANYIEIEVNVYAPVDNATTFVDIRGTNQLGVGENIADKLDATLYFENGRSIPVTSSMISIKAPIIEDGNIMFAGKWELTVKYYTAETTVYIEVGELFSDEVSEVEMGVTDVLEALNLRIRKINESGIVVYESCDVTVTKVIVIVSSSKEEEIPLEKAFINGSYKFNKNLAWKDKTMKVTLQYELFGDVKERTIEIKTICEDTAVVPYSTGTNFYPNQPFGSMFYVKGADNKYYYDRFDNGKLVMKKDATSAYSGEEYKITFADKKTGEAVELDSTTGTIKKAGTYVARFEWVKSGAYIEKDINVYDNPLASKYATVDKEYSYTYAITPSSLVTWNYGVDELVDDETPVTFSNWWTKSSLSYVDNPEVDGAKIWALTYSATNKVDGKDVKSTKIVPDSNVSIKVVKDGVELSDYLDNSGKIIKDNGHYVVTIDVTVNGKKYTSTSYFLYK